MRPLPSNLQFSVPMLVALIALSFTGTLRSEEFKTTRLAGWTVLSARNVTKENLDTLELTLKELNQIFPPKFLKIVHRIPIQIDGKDDEPQGGKAEQGRYDFKRVITDGVEMPRGPGKIHIFSAKNCGNKNLLVHELSHAAQNLTIGKDDERVKAAYREVVEKSLYPKDCYLMKNDFEYFAEMSVVYLSRLHYFPHDRETLKKHDPVSYKLMEDFWEGKLQKP